jgi:hypothetical protein
LIPCKGGEADVDPIQIDDKIADDKKRHEPHRNLGDRTSFDLIHLMLPMALSVPQRVSLRDKQEACGVKSKGVDDPAVGAGACMNGW